MMTMNIGYRKKRGGYTLMEAVVVILLVSIIALSIYWLIRIPLDAVSSMAAKRALYQEGRVLVESMVRELREMNSHRVIFDPAHPEWYDQCYTGPYTEAWESYSLLYWSSLRIAKKDHIKFDKSAILSWGSAPRSLLTKGPMVEFAYDLDNKTIIKKYPMGAYGESQTLPEDTEFVIARDVDDLTFTYIYFRYSWPSGEQEYSYLQQPNDGIDEYTPNMVRVSVTLRRAGYKVTVSGFTAIRKRMITDLIYWWDPWFMP